MWIRRTFPKLMLFCLEHVYCSAIAGCLVPGNSQFIMNSPHVNLMGSDKFISERRFVGNIVRRECRDGYMEEVC